MIRRWLAAFACLAPCLCLGQAAGDSAPAACARFLGSWSGTWSQGFYGTQWIHVTEVSVDCVAKVAYSPSGEAPQSTHPIPVNDGAMAFTCNRGTGGTCRLEVKGDELWATYTDPSGFVNAGVFRKNR